MATKGATTRVVLSVPNIHCGHCVRTIVRELKTLPEVVSVEGDAEKKVISVEYSSDALDKIRAALGEIGYPSSN